MRKLLILVMMPALLLVNSCVYEINTSPGLKPSNITQYSIGTSPGYIPWGFYDFEIARDGSYADVIPNRVTNSVMWGYHMNVVKFLETAPCTNCLTLKNIHLLSNGDVSVDISLRHPFMDRRYTGFDVRGIIMFPASQIIPDNQIREQMGYEPVDFWKLRMASHEKGDAELMNPDGWTVAWSPDEGEIWDYDWYQRFAPDTEMPIFRYFDGKFSAGEELSTLSAFKRYHSNEVRHMFEVGQAIAQTYIIRPPETGPIIASYAIYAHWFPADVIPVVDPATDFPPEANSPLPYEFYVTQDAPLDPDAPSGELEKVHWHIKTWSIGNGLWEASGQNLAGAGTGGGMVPHPSGEPDDYIPVTIDYFFHYTELPNDGFPGTYPFLCIFGSRNPKDFVPALLVGQEVYIVNFEYAPLDGVW